MNLDGKGKKFNFFWVSRSRLGFESLGPISKCRNRTGLGCRLRRNWLETWSPKALGILGRRPGPRAPVGYFFGGRMQCPRWIAGLVRSAMSQNWTRPLVASGSFCSEYSNGFSGTLCAGSLARRLWLVRANPWNQDYSRFFSFFVKKRKITTRESSGRQYSTSFFWPLADFSASFLSNQVSFPRKKYYKISPK